MNSRIYTLALVAACLSTLPSLAQSEISNNQPVTRKMTKMELRIQAKLKLDFKQGLIDSDQLSAMQRDLDAIMVKEDDFKSRGFTDKRKAEIYKMLERFEARLDQAAGVSTTSQADAKNGPKASANNKGLSKIAPTK